MNSCEQAFANGIKTALKRKNLAPAICNAIQNTAFRCDEYTRAMCKVGSGECYTCRVMAHSIQKEVIEKCLGNVG